MNDGVAEEVLFDVPHNGVLRISRTGHTDSMHWTTLVIVLAFVKVRWVLLDFIKLRSAPMKLRVLFEAWVVGVAALLILFNWLGA